MSTQIDKIEQLNTLKYIATLFYYDGPVELVLHDEKLDNYYLCMISSLKENKYAFFSGEKEDFGLLLTGNICMNKFVRKSNYKFCAMFNTMTNNIVDITFTEHITDLDGYLTIDDDSTIMCAESVGKLPMDAFLKYANFKISGNGLDKFISYFDESI